MRKYYLSALALLFSAVSYNAVAQCEEGQVLVEIEIVPDSWPQEISWELTDENNSIILSGGATGNQLCVEAGSCLVFTAFDSYGDGIFSPGGYWIYIDGELTAQGYDYGYGESQFINCPPGFSCNDPVLVTPGEYTTEWVDYWYVFTPDQTGMYLVSTCGESCDTKVWIYDYCNMNNFDDTNEAAIYYDDNAGGCGEQGQINALLEAGVTYFIRIGDDGGDCGESTLGWSLTFNGPPTGCMDPLACNYAPLAEVDSGDCIYPGDEDCTGPDLIVLEDAIANSLSAQTLAVGEGDCYINEGCLNGYGTREIIRFTTHIKNIGDIDYYIGPPGDQNPGQFEFDNCHSHWHYEGYARYDLFDMDNNFIPIGFKNGFCVLDLECSGGGTAQFGCGNQGISAGCGDIYGSGLNCQWIDVTGVADGQYSLIVRVNWDYTPDALGRYENSYENNWAQVCIEIDRSNGFEVNLIDDCPMYVDCMGEEFGSAVSDCNGDCNGTALMGDLDNNGLQQYADAYGYVEHILGNDISATPCNDLNQDGDISVTDAALLALCQFYNEAHTHPDSSGVHDKCNFPGNNFINPFDTVYFKIGNASLNDNYIDIHVMNPDNRIVGYQFKTTGIEITDVISLYDPLSYPIDPSYALGGDQVIGLSYQDSSIAKNYEFVPLCRVYFMSPPGEEICLDEIIDVVNEDYHNTINIILDGCLTTVGVSEMANPFNASLYPNPFTDKAVLKFHNPRRASHRLEVMDLSGRIVQVYGDIRDTEVTIERDQLTPGTYLYRLIGEYEQTGRMVIE